MNITEVTAIACGVVAFVCLAALADGYLRPHAVKPAPPQRFEPVRRVAVLIASRNGAGTIAGAVDAALCRGVEVYVVSDGSTDDTAACARAAGAIVLELSENVGKPGALFAAYEHFGLSQRYDALAILDDDVIVEPDFLHEALLKLTPDVAISVGKNLTSWPDEHRWNVLIASRAYSYWAYQLMMRRFQSRFGIMNCISGSNSVYRTEVLDVVLTGSTPYIVDDTYWTLETHRLELGRIVFAPRARAWLQDPHRFGDWYKQNLRWLWGTFQGIIGHRIGSKTDRFHLSYLVLMLQWSVYVVATPFTVVMVARHLTLHTVLVFVGGYALWVTAAAVALRRPRLVLFAVPILLLDVVFRLIFVHGVIKAIRQPTVESCTWASPERFATATPAAPRAAHPLHPSTTTTHQEVFT